MPFCTRSSWNLFKYRYNLTGVYTVRSRLLRGVRLSGDVQLNIHNLLNYDTPIQRYVRRRRPADPVRLPVHDATRVAAEEHAQILRRGEAVIVFVMKPA